MRKKTNKKTEIYMHLVEQKSTTSYSDLTKKENKQCLF